MDVLALAIAIVALGITVVVLARRLSKAEATPVPVDPVDQRAELEVRAAEESEGAGAVELWWPGGGRLASVRPVGQLGAGTAIRSPWMRKAVLGVLRRAGKTARGNPGTYRLTFPADLMDTLSKGGTVDIMMGGAPLTALGRGVGTAMGGPTIALAAGAVAMSVVQQQRLDRALAVIEQRIDLVIDRMRDDDHGRLDAAEALLGHLERRSAELPSAQLRAELAAARQTIDAVYFARRRYGQRLGDAIGDAQEASQADGGAAQTWASGVLDAVGDPEQLRSELLVYLRAVVVRARLATSTSAILAIDGDIDDANRLLGETVQDLRSDFYGLYRRLRPLAQWAPKRSLPWKRRDWDRAHETMVEVYELMAGEVEPLLPDAEPRPIELDVTVDEHGEMDDVRILE